MEALFRAQYRAIKAVLSGKARAAIPRIFMLFVSYLGGLIVAVNPYCRCDNCGKGLADKFISRTFHILNAFPNDEFKDINEVT